MKITAYASFSLRELVGAVAVNSSADALATLLEHRTIFSISVARALLFTELLRRLADTARQRGWGIYADTAVSLTTDRFSRFSPDGTGIDCRTTYRVARDLLAQRQHADELEEELELARILNALAHRHFELALREARRSDSRTRFVWSVGGRALRLLLPRTLVRGERKAWLERHVSDVQPDRPGERERVQGIVDGTGQTATERRLAQISRCRSFV